MVDTFSNGGRLGIGDKLLKSTEPFYCEFKTPVEVTENDILRIPIMNINSTNDEMNVDLNYKVIGDGLSLKKQKDEIKLGGDKRERVILEMKVNNSIKINKLIVSSNAGAFSDTVTRKINIVPIGFVILDY